MSKFSEQQKNQQLKQERDRFVRELVAKTIHSMSIVTYTGMVVGVFASILQHGKITWMHVGIAFVGLFIAIVLILMGNNIGRK